MKTTFVILHYLAADVTAGCITSLLNNFPGEEVRFVVVDNASPDGSGAALKDRFSAYSDRLHFVLLPENVGFARGNNAGYEYAVRNFSPDFVIVMNNDVVIPNPAFLQRVEAEYASEPFAVLGPDIYCPFTGISQSPVTLSGMTLDRARSVRWKMYLKSRIPLLGWLFRSKVHKVKSPAFRAFPQRDCVLHGSCYIFSRDFISKRPLAFNPLTFLYAEEDILHVECMRAGLTMRYCPSLKVLHYEDSSTNAACGSESAKMRMKYSRLVESLDIFISILDRE